MGMWRITAFNTPGHVGRCRSFSFDFAKTMTTGEGGMLLFGTKMCFDGHALGMTGHENNPTVPRWEDKGLIAV